ncbi:hypothetical protein JCM16303_002496 [Sporobolomyces ruberrimus]
MTPSAPEATPSPTPMISLGLARITRLLEALKSPHAATPVVHIAGTNGKGSVSAYLASTLHAADIRVGRFNSPHLVDEWDCVRLQEKVVDERVFKEAKEEVESVNRREALEATPFEILTATAFSLFARSSLEVAVVEVGMGGTGDATNVVPATKTLLSILTAVDLDHQGFLGDTVEAIAAVKSGIVRQGGDLVVGRQAYPEVLEVAKSITETKGARLWQARSGSYVATTSPSTTGSRQASISLSPASVSPTPPSHPPSSDRPPPTSILANLPLPGSYQLDNSATATLAAQLLRTLPRTTEMVPRLASIPDEALRIGIERTRWDGRLQWLELLLPRSHESSDVGNHCRRILLDGAHNPSSAKLLASYLSSLPPSDRPTTLVFGLSAPRQAPDVLEPLLDRSTGIKKVVCVEFSPPVGMPWVKATRSEELYRAVAEMGVVGVTVQECRNVEEAFAQEVDEGEVTVVAGSLYLVADALRFARDTATQ